MQLKVRYLSLLLIIIVVASCEFLDESISDPDANTNNLNCAYPILEKQQNIYIGVINPITINVADEDDTTLLVTATNMQITKTGNFTYEATATQPGTAQLVIDGVHFDNPISYQYQVKRIPDPVARLGNNTSGSIPSGEFRAQAGVGAFLDNFDFDARCDVIGFELTYIARSSDPVQVINQGARYNASAQNLISQAVPGDIYIFTNVRARCPGDNVSREVNSMTFFIR